MIAVDTNVVVRLLTRDDPTQFEQSRVLFQQNDVFIPDTVILECEWVLRYAYKSDAAVINKGLTTLFGLPNVRLSDSIAMAQALKWHAAGLDFADALHLAQSQSVTQFYTFDKKLVNKAKQIAACEVLSPAM